MFMKDNMKLVREVETIGTESGYELIKRQTDLKQHNTQHKDPFFIEINLQSPSKMLITAYF